MVWDPIDNKLGPKRAPTAPTPNASNLVNAKVVDNCSKGRLGLWWMLRFWGLLMLGETFFVPTKLVNTLPPKNTKM